MSKEMVWPLLITRDEQGQGHKAGLTRGGRRCLSRPGLSHSPSLCPRHSVCLSVFSPCLPTHQFQEEEEEDGEPERNEGPGQGKGVSAPLTLDSRSLGAG